MRSSLTYRGLPETSEFFGSLNYVYGLSDFWAFIFSDKEIVDRTLEATSYQLADLYSKFIQLTSTVSLQDIRSTFHSQLKLALIDETLHISDVESVLSFKGLVLTPTALPVDTGLLGDAYHCKSDGNLYVSNGLSWNIDRSFYKYLMPYAVTSCKYLMDRPFLPKVTLENKIHFYVNASNNTIELSKDLTSLGLPSRKVSKTSKVTYIAEMIGANAGKWKVYLGSTGYFQILDTKPDFDVGDDYTFEVPQYALWTTDVEVDEGALWSYFGRFVNISPSTSTDMYKDYIRGLYFLYSRGPTVRLLQLGLNSCIGIPTARDTETVIHSFQDPESGNFTVVTANNSYVIPYGIPPDSTTQTTAGVELAQVAQIRDYKTTEDWWVNVSIPETILNGSFDGRSKIAAPGTSLEYYMRSFLKYHTFLVNIKLVSSFSNESVQSIANLLNSAKAAYTLPIFVWQVPVTQDCLSANDDDFSAKPTLRLGDVLLYGEMIKRAQNIARERGGGRWIRSNGDISAYVGDTVSVDHGLEEVIEGAEYSAVSGTVTITRVAHGLTSGEEIYIFDANAVTEGWYVVTVTGLDTFEVFSGTEDEAFPLSYRYTRLLPDATLIPLYTLTVTELKQKLLDLTMALPVPHPKRFVVGGLDGTQNSVYRGIFMREYPPGTPTTGIGYNSNDLDQYVLEAKRRFIPVKADLGSSEEIAFFQVVYGIYSAYLVRPTNTLFTPVYFPARAEDPIQITIQPTVGSPSTHYVDESF